MEKLNYLQNGDDILVDQAKNFIRTTLGLFVFHPLLTNRSTDMLL